MCTPCGSHIRRLIWVYTVCSSLSVRIHTINIVKTPLILKVPYKIVADEFLLMLFFKETKTRQTIYNVHEMSKYKCQTKHLNIKPYFPL